ncbi:MAG: carbon-nitrogen hydrolase family protein [Desulfarculus sp.]|jgi:nitrilase|nr:MAG: carbon-nitrogen hydrolase family protein [Desulfarculus sp.]
MIAAVIQTQSTEDREANLEQAAELLAQAKEAGAGFAVLPEHFAYLADMSQMPATAQPLKGPLLKFLSQQAAKHGMWIVGGSYAQRVRGTGRVFNTCPVVDDQGRLQGYYQKIHRFDLEVPGQAAWTESKYVRAGQRLVTVESPAGILGLTIGYDLRFPELYRRLRLKGATVFTAPSTYAKGTGREHWELLVRTRALENSCYVLAAAQWGPHGGGRESWGQSMIAGPWGEVLAQCEPGKGVALAEVSLQRVSSARRRLDSTAQAQLLPRIWRELL